MAAVGSSFHMDISEMTKLAATFNNGPRLLRSELQAAMDDSAKNVIEHGRRRVNNRTGNYGRSFQKQVQTSVSGVVGIIRNAAKSAKGFIYAGTLEWGRGPIHAIRAKALRFEVGGQVLFRKSVGPAPAQHIVEFAAKDAEPYILGRFWAVVPKIAERIERG